MEQFIVLDFETYYDRQYSLAKIPTQQYIDSPLFEIIGVAVLHDGDMQHFSGTLEETAEWLRQFPFDTTTTVAHNAMFDGGILERRLGIHPRRYFCTASAARGIMGTILKSVSLANVSSKLGVGTKGTEVIKALGKRREDFTPRELEQYMSYCRNDVRLTAVIAQMFWGLLPELERNQIDATIKKFTRPQLRVDIPMLETRKLEVQAEKRKLLDELGIEDRTELMSNSRFMDLLRRAGLPENQIPMKPSPSNPEKMIPAFSKADEAFTDLLEHENPRVSALVEARLAHKSTIEETRTQRFIDATQEAGGELCVPLRYAGAHTLRYSGSDGINMQNLAKKSILRKAIKALKPGHVVLAGDLSQIEARLVATLAGETQLIEAFSDGHYVYKDNEIAWKGRDVYKEFATVLYGKDLNSITDQERFVAKCAILMLGYGAGHVKFYNTMRASGVKITMDEAKYTVDTYRNTYSRIRDLWYRLDDMISAMKRGDTVKFGPVVFNDQGWKSPGGMKIVYPKIRRTNEGWMYLYRQHTWKKLYGGALLENICQHLGRMILAGAEDRMTNHGFMSALSVHDELVYTTLAQSAMTFAKLLKIELTRSVDWLPELPIGCEIKWGESYADCK